MELELPLVDLTPLPSLVYQTMDYPPLDLVSNVLQELPTVPFQEILLLSLHV